jgi:hypothetical protein
MMPSDDIIVKATTLTTQVQALIPKIWAARLEKNLRLQACLQQSLIVNNDLTVPDAGDTVYVPILPDLAAAVALTEGTDMTPIALNTATSIPLVPSEVGATIEITRKALDRMKYDGIGEIIDRLAYAMSLYIETRIASLYNATVPGTANSLNQVYANGKTSATITSADTFNDQMLLNGIEKLESLNNVPFEDGAFQCFITPSQWAALLQDTNTRQDLRWADPMPRLIDAPVGQGSLGGGYGRSKILGERGMLHGVRIIVTNYIQQDTENSVSVNNALLVAPRWAAIAYKRKPETVVDPTLYDMGRRRRFGVVADLDIELLHAERGVVLKSA